MSPEQFQLTVQGVLRQQMSQQIRMQEELRRRQMEQRQFQEFQRLQHLQNQLKLQESQSKPTDSSAGSQGSMLSKLMATSDASKLVKVVQPPQPSSVTTNPQSNTVKVIRPEQKGFMGNYITNSLLKKNASQPQKVNQSQPSAAISNVIDLSVDDNSPVKKVVVKNAEKIGTKDSPKAQKEKNLIEEKKSEPDVFEPSQRGRTRKKINYLEK